MTEERGNPGRFEARVGRRGWVWGHGGSEGGGSRSVYRGLTMGPSLAARNLWTPPQNASEKGGGGGDIPGRTNSGLGVPAPAVVFGDAGGDPWT